MVACGDPAAEFCVSVEELGGLRVRGKEVTKCYMRVTAPFPTQTDTAQNEDIISLFFSAMQRGRRHFPSRFCTEKKDKWDKKMAFMPPAVLFDSTQMRLRPP